MNKSKGVVSLFLVLAAWLVVPSNGQAVFGLFGQNQVVKAVDGEIRIPLSEVEDGKARHYVFKTESKDISFFLVKAPDGVVRAAFDACDVCFHAKKGYTQDGQFMICNNCGMRFHVSKINQVEGGCNPAPVSRTVSGGNLVIKVADLLPGARFF